MRRFVRCFTAEPPPTARIDVIESVHGIEIRDPYRWLEDRNSEAVREWVTAQADYVRLYLDGIPPRPAILRRLKELSGFERIPTRNTPHGSAPAVTVRCGKIFSARQRVEDQHPRLYIRENDGEDRLLLDPASHSKTVSITCWEPSPDASHLVYGLSTSGSDWQQWYVRSVASGQDLPDKLSWIKFSTPSWVPNGSGFFYSRFPKPRAGQSRTAVNRFQSVFFHRLGTPQEDDVLLYCRRDQPSWTFDAFALNDGRHVLLIVSDGTRTEKLVLLHDRIAGRTFEWVSEFRGYYLFLGVRDRTAWFFTSDAAPRGRIIAADFTNPVEPSWREIVPERAEPLENVVYSDGLFFCEYLKDASSRVRVYDCNGVLDHDIALPEFGSVSWALSEESPQFFTFTSFDTPPLLYCYHANERRSHQIAPTNLPFVSKTYVTRQLFVFSKDGTRIPVFLTAHRDRQPGQPTPLLLIGHGGFGVCLKPCFRVQYLAFLEMGGMLAVANIRGGGEYGDEWHEAGAKSQKQNTFDDFIAVSEALIARGFTSRQQLAIQGASSGALTVAACLNQRPDLFGAAVLIMGVLDMLRFHKYTFGAAWTAEYGSPDDPEELKTLLKYSPVHNVQSGMAYPPIMIVVAEGDDRVVPAHSYKFGAALQAAESSRGKVPVLLRIERFGGHGFAKPLAIQLKEQADILAFLYSVVFKSEPILFGPDSDEW